MDTDPRRAARRHGATTRWPAAIALALAAAVLPAAAIAGSSGGRAETLSYGQHADLGVLAADIAARRDLDPQWVRDRLAQARHLPQVARLIMPPPAGTAKNWAAYRARFVEPVRLRAGSDWWAAHADWLARAEARWGVPPEVVVAIVGIETLYGRHPGTFRVLDALATLSFDFPIGRRDRSSFFRDELAAFLAWTRNEGLDPTEPRGSFAGAIGLPQFMPSSILRHGVDFDGDGRIDLRRSTPDVIGSVARYLAEFGWQRGRPAVFDVAAPVETSDRAALLGPDIVPSFTATQFAERGARLSEAGRAHDGLLALVELQNGSAAPTYVAGTVNFYAITRYNWSAYYAMAVIDLADALRARRDALLAGSATGSPRP